MVKALTADGGGEAGDLGVGMARNFSRRPSS